MGRFLTFVGDYFLRFRALLLLSRRVFIIFLCATVAFVFAYQLYLKAPADFPIGSKVRIEKGASLGEISEGLWTKHLIRSPLMFKLTVFLAGGSRSLKAGDYVFSEPLSGPGVAFRLMEGKFGLAPAKLTVPEGATVRDIARIASNAFPGFDTAAFLALAEPKEGYLFPDTYLFFPGVTAEEVVLAMEENFREKLANMYEDLKRSRRSTRDVVIMASLLEKEARREEDRKLISGILWKRLDIGMALQVDAAFAYVIDKNTYELTTADLRTDSPYNTYTRRGLPAGPIGNPGEGALRAAMQPTASEYLYYLSDRRGNVYYSSTYEAHLKQKAIHVN